MCNILAITVLYACPNIINESEYQVITSFSPPDLFEETAVHILSIYCIYCFSAGGAKAENRSEAVIGLLSVLITPVLMCN